MALTLALISFSLMQSSPGGQEGAAGVERQRDGKVSAGKFYCDCYACNVYLLVYM